MPIVSIKKRRRTREEDARHVPAPVLVGTLPQAMLATAERGARRRWRVRGRRPRGPLPGRGREASRLVRGSRRGRILRRRAVGRPSGLLRHIQRERRSPSSVRRRRGGDSASHSTAGRETPPPGGRRRSEPIVGGHDEKAKERLPRPYRRRTRQGSHPSRGPKKQARARQRRRRKASASGISTIILWQSRASRRVTPWPAPSEGMAHLAVWSWGLVSPRQFAPTSHCVVVDDAAKS